MYNSRGSKNRVNLTMCMIDATFRDEHRMKWMNNMWRSVYNHYFWNRESTVYKFAGNLHNKLHTCNQLVHMLSLQPADAYMMQARKICEEIDC